MASRPAQDLKAKSKAETFGLFALSPYYFLYLLFG